MVKIHVKGNPNPSKRKINPERPKLEQLGLPNPGPSSRGSTYYKKLLACPREHALYAEVGLRPQVLSEALTIGVLFHQALQEYYMVGFDYQREHLATNTKRTDDFYWAWHKEGMRAAYAVVDKIAGQPDYEKEYKKLMDLLDAYFQQYHRQDRWEILAVEETLEWHGKFVYTSRLDLIVFDRAQGGMFIVEHKTASSLGDDLLDSYEMDWQVLGQVWLFNRCVDLSKYPPFLGVYINLITKHTEPRMVRFPVNPSPAHLRDFERNFTHWLHMRRAAAQAGWPKSLGACSGYARGYAKCDYYSLCQAFPENTVQDWIKEPEPLGFEKVG